MARIKIAGFIEAKVIEDIFDSSMVDVAYIDEVTNDAIYIVGDVGINFEKPDDFEWVKEVIEDTLAQHSVLNLEITLVREYLYDRDRTMNELDNAIREFKPINGDWLPLEGMIEQAFSSADPKVYFKALFNLFERFPEEDGSGVFWSALHGMEAVGGYEELLVLYFHRWPSHMTRTMLRRIYNSGQTHIGKVAIAKLISIEK